MLAEDVDHEIHVVHQHPLGLVVAFHAVGRNRDGVQPLADIIGNGLNLPRIAPAANHKVIGKSARVLIHLQNGEVGCLLVFAGLKGGCDLLSQRGIGSHSTSGAGLAYSFIFLMYSATAGLTSFSSLPPRAIAARMSVAAAGTRTPSSRCSVMPRSFSVLIGRARRAGRRTVLGRRLAGRASATSAR